MKTCNNCFETKEYNQFYKEAKSKDGYRKQCKNCKNQKTLNWRKENKEHYNSTMRKYNQKHYDKLRLHRYKLSMEEYENLLLNQDNKCKLCNKSPSKNRPLAIDHCHKTGKVRGLLCYNCNRGMHYIDNMEFLDKAIKYANT